MLVSMTNRQISAASRSEIRGRLVCVWARLKSDRLLGLADNAQEKGGAPCCDRTWQELSLVLSTKGAKLGTSGAVGPSGNSDQIANWDDFFLFSAKTRIDASKSKNGQLTCCKVAAWFGLVKPNGNLLPRDAGPGGAVSLVNADGGKAAIKPVEKFLRFSDIKSGPNAKPEV